MIFKNFNFFDILKNNYITLILIISFVYLLINIFFITNEFYLFSLIPLFLIVLYYYFTNINLVFFIAVALTPLSANLKLGGGSLGLSLPAEPLFFGIMILFLMKLLHKNILPKKFTFNIVSIFIIFHVFWMFITSITSQINIVSFKYFIMQLWFIIPLYFFGHIVLKNKKRIFTFFILIIISISITVIYTSIRHAINDFGDRAGRWVMQPFYNDHTAYGAVLAMVLPIVLAMVFKLNKDKFLKFYMLLSLFVISIGIFLSFSRATWLSIALSFAFYIVVVFNIKKRYIVLSSIAVLIIFYLNFDNIMMKLERNRQDSSTHFVEHVQSISNISTDASNLERINRWQAAFRMFNDYPVFGTGPGTYQFLYAPYQKSKEKTIISTNAGNMGNAHSEYIGILSERGVLGFVFFVSIIITVFIIGILAYHRLYDKELKLILIATLCGLFSYIVHGFMNNFLDTENASVLFWGFITIIVKLSIFSKSKYNIENQENIDENQII